MNTVDQTKIQWEIAVPIFRDFIILKQLAMAIGIPFGFVAVILLFATRGKIPSIYALYGLGLVGALFLLTFILIMVLYGGKYAAGFVMDSKGILNYTQKKQAKNNLILNGFTVVLGLLSGKPAAAGAGILAQSRQRVLVKWNRIIKVTYYPQNYTIMIKGGFPERIAVFCTAENYSKVEECIRDKASNAIMFTR